MQFSLGDVLARSFRLLGRQGLPYLATSALILSPILLLMFLLQETFARTQNFAPPMTDPATPDDEFNPILEALGSLYTDLFVWQGSITFSEWLLTPIMTAALIANIFSRLRGVDEAIGASLSRIPGMLPRVFVVGLLYALGTGIGMICCCLPGIFVAVAAFVAVPVAVVESVSPIAAFKRSWQLIRPKFWLIFAIGLIIFMGSQMLGAIIAIAMPFVPVSVGFFLIWLFRVVVLTISTVISCVTYYDLRVASEGLGREDVAEIFA